MTIKGKTILVTGGARRVGREFCLAAASAGANVIIHYGNSAEDAKKTAQEIRAAGCQAWTLKGDLANPDEAANLVNKAWEISPFFGLVNNAAIFEPLTLTDTTIDAWQHHLAVNLTAPFLLSQSFARRLAPGAAGRIINILDWRALRPGSDHFPYTVSKAALAQMTRSLAVALAPDISVNGLALGAILPPNIGGSPDILKTVPLKRWVSMDELQQALLFLLEGPSYITGEIIHLEGGRHLV